MKESLGSKEIQIIEALRDQEPVKINMVKLNRYYNKANGLSYNYCLCTATELKVFKNKFYDWYDNEYTV